MVRLQSVQLKFEKKKMKIKLKSPKIGNVLIQSIWMGTSIWHTWVKINIFFRLGHKGKVRKLKTSGKFGHTFANSGNPGEKAPL